MHSLALLIAAAAAVNAIPKGEVKAVVLPDNQIACTSDNCAAHGIFLGRSGVCLEKNARVSVDLTKDGRPGDLYADTLANSFTCGDESEVGDLYTLRDRQADEAPSACPLLNYTLAEVDIQCAGDGEILQLEEVQKQLGAEPPAAPQQQQQQQQQSPSCNNIEAQCERKGFVTLRLCKERGTDFKFCSDTILKAVKGCKAFPQEPRSEPECKEQEAQCERKAFVALEACNERGIDMGECSERILTEVQRCKGGQ